MESCGSSTYEFDLNSCESDAESSISLFNGSPPSLDKVLRELSDDEEDSKKLAETYTKQNENNEPPINTLLNYNILIGISTQIKNAEERINGGMATTLTTCPSTGGICVGTAHGIIFSFDNCQILKWCSRQPDYGGVSALAINLDGTRLLSGYERGYILMLDMSSGDILRTMPDAHAPFTAVLHLRFADWSNLAYCADSAGCVFSLTFNRRLGVRTYDSKCIFSGSRGEVCAIEPLTSDNTITSENDHLKYSEKMRSQSLVAMATLSKVILISVKPRLRVIFSMMLIGSSDTLPLLCWLSYNDHITLSFARNTQLYMYQLQTWSKNQNSYFTSSNQPNSDTTSPLLRKTFTKPLRAIHYLGSRALCVCDSEEKLHLYDTRTFILRETIDLSQVRLVYASAHFKGLATGGAVSAALSRAGEHACYGSMATGLYYTIGQSGSNSSNQKRRRLYLLGVNGQIHSISVRSVHEQIKYLKELGRWPDVFKLVTQLKNINIVENLINEYLSSTDEPLQKKHLQALVQCCIKLKLNDQICGEIWEKVSDNAEYERMFFEIIEEHIVKGDLTYLSPTITQKLVTYHQHRHELNCLESILPNLDVCCLDLHQLLSLCKKYNLFKINLWLNSSTLHDFIQPLDDILENILINHQQLTSYLGNELLVYICCCLDGRIYPKGELSTEYAKLARKQMFNYLLKPPYKLLKTLLIHDPYACVSLFELSLNESIRYSKEKDEVLESDELEKEAEQEKLFLIVGLLCDLAKETHSENAVYALICRLLLNKYIKKIESKEIYLKLIENWLLKPNESASIQMKEQLLIDLLDQKLLNICDDVLLEKCEVCRYYRLQERLLEKNENYAKIFNCYLNDQSRCQDIFGYIRKYSDSTSREIRQQILENFKNLIDINLDETLSIITELFPELITSITEKLSSLSRSDKDQQILLKLLHRALDANCPISSHLANLAYEAGDCELAARLLERAGDLCGALNLLLNNRKGDESTELAAASLCARAPQPASLFNTINDPKLLLRLFNATLADSSYQILLYQKTFKLMSTDLHIRLSKQLSKVKRGKYVQRGTPNMCVIHQNMECPSLLDNN